VGGASKKALAPIANIERREKSRLARGHREIDARIDLHGMTQARAHRALLGFLHRSQAEGCRYVLVITGKGKILSDGSERGVLRRIVPEWLALAEFRALVTGYEEAAIGHGGAGALYVRVRRG
jgi:DNA-nicking Smr family endonuclease